MSHEFIEEIDQLKQALAARDKRIELLESFVLPLMEGDEITQESLDHWKAEYLNAIRHIEGALERDKRIADLEAKLAKCREALVASNKYEKWRLLHPIPDQISKTEYIHGLELEGQASTLLRAALADPPAEETQKVTPETQGCTCQKCLRPYHIDLLIPDELWEQVNPARPDGFRDCELLCGSCIMELLEARLSFSAFRLIPVSNQSAEDAEEEKQP